LFRAGADKAYGVLKMLPLMRAILWLFFLGQAFSQIGCDLEDLPTTFNNYGLLDFNLELHVQGKFYANFSKFRETMNFNILTPTAARFYIAPHDVDAGPIRTYSPDMLIANRTSGRTLALSSWGIDTDESIAITLPPGSYSLTFYYWDRSK
jgi:hypothetical protein